MNQERLEKGIISMKIKKLPKIKDLPDYQRPREKIMGQGAGYLTDQELLAVLIGSGNEHISVEKIAESLINKLKTLPDKITFNDVKEVKGIGMAKAAVLVAALEFARRRVLRMHKKIMEPQDILPFVHKYRHRKQECLICVSLNGAHEIIDHRVVSIGIVNRTLVHPREVFADPIVDRAAAIMIAHNHPSGNVEPSEEDRAVTFRLVEAGLTLGIRVLDHVIFTKEDYYSFLENGEI